MFCSNCGNPLPEDAANCPNCGEPKVEVNASPSAAEAGRPAEGIATGAPAASATLAQAASAASQQALTGEISGGGASGVGVPGASGVPITVEQPEMDLPLGQDAQSGQPAQGAPGQPQAGATATGYAPAGYGPQGYAPAGYNPVTGAAVPPAAPRQKLSNKTIGIIAAVAVAVVAVVGLLVFFLTREGTPLDMARQAMEKTRTVIAEEQEATRKTLGFGTAKDHAGAQKIAMDMGIQVPGVPGSISIEMNGDTDLENRKLHADFAIGASGMSLFDAAIDAEDDWMVVAIPFLLQDRYGFNTSTFGRDYNAADWAGADEDEWYDLTGEWIELPEVDRDFGFNIFDDLAQNANGQAESYEAARKAINERYDALWQAAGGEKAAKKETVTVGGAEKNCTVYTVTFTRDAVLDFCYDVADILLEDETVGPLLDTMALSTYYYDDAWEMVDELLAELEQELAGDVTYTIYTENRAMVRWDIDIPLEDDDVHAEFGFGDANHLSNALSIYVEVDDVWIEFTNKGNHVLKDGKYTTEFELLVSEDGYTQTFFDGHVTYDSKADTDNCVLYAGIANGLLTLNAKGTVNADPAAHTFEADLSDITLRALGQSITMDVLYTIEPSDGPVFDDSGVTGLFDLNMEEVADLIMEMREKLDAYSAMGSMLY